MVKNLFIFAAVAMLLTACEPRVVDESNTRTITFHVMGNFTTQAFPDSSDDPSMHAPASAGSLSADGVEMTDLLIYDYKDGELVQVVHQTSSDADFGVPSLALTFGRHRLSFLCHCCSHVDTRAALVVFDRPRDAFALTYEMDVARQSGGGVSVTLNRCAAKFRLVLEDAIPSDCQSITLTPSVWYNGWDMEHGVPLVSTDYSATYDIPEQWAGQSGASINMWTLSPTEEWQTDIRVVSRSDAEVLEDITLQNVPMLANRVTIYSGKLHEGTESFGITLASDWLDSYNGSF